MILDRLLGSKTAGDLLALGVDPSTIAKLLPYLGLRGQPAFDYVSKTPLNLTPEQASNLTGAVMQRDANTVANAYNNNSSDHSLFAGLPSNTKTAVVDLFFQYGPSVFKQNAWTEITSGNWSGFAKNLDSFGDSYGSRRQAESALIKSDIASGLLHQH